MDLNEIRALIENNLSPELYKLDNDYYGLHYGDNFKKNIKKILITFDLSLNTIHHAIKNRINLIISFHGLINKPVNNFNKNLVSKLNLLSKYPLSIFILNSSFISSEGGISDVILELLFLKLDRTFNILNYNHEEIPIGRIAIPKFYINNKNALTLEMLIKRIINNYNINNISYVGELNKIINKICIIGGEMFKIEYIDQAHRLGCNCFISGKFDHFGALYAKDMGMTLIQIPFYESVCIALNKLSNLLSLKYPNEEFYFFKHENPIHIYG